MYFCFELRGFSGMVRLMIPAAIIGRKTFSRKYFSVLIPQKSCSSARVRGIEQYSSKSCSFSVGSLILTSVLTSVLTCPAGPTVAVATSGSGTMIRNISPSILADIIKSFFIRSIQSVCMPRIVPLSFTPRKIWPPLRLEKEQTLSYTSLVILVVDFLNSTVRLSPFCISVSSFYGKLPYVNRES